LFCELEDDRSVKMKKAGLGGMWGKMGTAERGKKGRESRVMGARVG
jgi:hypothetical protein